MISYSDDAAFLQEKVTPESVSPHLIYNTKTPLLFPLSQCKCKSRKAPNNGDGKWSEQYKKWLYYPCRNKGCLRHWRNYARAHYLKYRQRAKGYKHIYLIRLSCKTQLAKGSEAIAKTANKLLKAYPESYIFAVVHRGKSGLDHVHLAVNTNHEITNPVVAGAWKAHFPGKRVSKFDPKHDYSVKKCGYVASTGLYMLIGKREKRRKLMPWKGVAINPIRHYGRKKAPTTLYKCMPLQEDIYSIISGNATIVTLTHDQIAPVKPILNVDIPHLVYTVNSQPTLLTLAGVADMQLYSLTIDVYARLKSEVVDITEELTDTLNGLASGSITYCSLQGETEVEEESGFHTMQTYNVSYES